MEFSKEQQDFLSQCEEDFKDRYLESDGEFMKAKRAPPSNPPIVVPWYDNSQRQHGHRYRHRNRDFRDRRGDNNWDRNRDREGNRNQNRDWDRNRGRGNHNYGYQPYYK